VKKDYQKHATSATTPVPPEAVSVVLAELAGDVQEGLLAMAVGTGWQVMAAMMNADVEAVCGPKGRHDPARTAVRHGTGDGSVTLGGRRVPVTRPRMRAADGTGELPVAAYEGQGRRHTQAQHGQRLGQTLAQAAGRAGWVRSNSLASASSCVWASSTDSA